MRQETRFGFEREDATRPRKVVAGGQKGGPIDPSPHFFHP
jgi:hypothetical protein